MKGILILIAVLFLSLSLTAQEEREYDGVQGIAEIHSGWLIVRLPSFQKKLYVIDSLIQLNSMSPASRDKLVREKAETIANSYFISKWYPAVFESSYSFSKHAFIYTHETVAFLEGDLKAWDRFGMDVSIPKGSKIFFATLEGEVGDPLRFTSSNHLLLGFPFRNNIFARGRDLTFDAEIPAGLASLKPDDVKNIHTLEDFRSWIDSFIGNEFVISRVARHVSKANRRMHALFEKKYGVED